MTTTLRKIFGRSAPALASVAATLWASGALAQTQTFKLDRVEIPGAPDDTLMMARAVTQPEPTLFAQLGLGYSLNPLRTDNIYTVPNLRVVASAPSRGVVKDQLTVYTAVGAQLFNRFTVAAAFPFTPWQDGKNPDYQTSTTTGNSSTTVVSTDGPAAGDIRLDLRAVVARSGDLRAAFGASASAFVPLGTSANFGADQRASVMVGVQGEYAFNWLTIMATTGVHLRPFAAINSPANGLGLGIGNEWRWQVGAFVPIGGGQYRVGASIVGQTGIEKNADLIGDTFFTKRNTSIEWNVEGRAKLGADGRWWVGGGAGSFILNGYGAPDVRVMAMLGAYTTLAGSTPSEPERKPREKDPTWRESDNGDSDGDGIRDEVDACPSDPEDHLGKEPNDGCPSPPDRDGDGIPDQWDKCPDAAEDKDGINDGDGCPELDADEDGIADPDDACPKEPGSASPDTKKNGCPQFISLDGSVVRVLQQVHFGSGSATILADSFPMLLEIANLLRVNPSISRMSIEGHTDARGDAAMNKTLSQGRAASVMSWLGAHGVGAERLEAHGFGQERPLDSNATEIGRQANRRVEFKIVSEDDPNAVKKSQ